MGHSIPLINNLKIRIIFKDKAKEEKASVIDLINRLVQVLREDLKKLAVSTRDAGLIELIKL